MEHYALPAEVYAVGLIFSRVAAMVMLLPGIGETSVPPRIRLALAFLLSLILYPLVRTSLPAIPAGVDGLFGQVAVEILIGLGLGAILRLFMSALAVTGEIVSLQTTLSFAQTTNPTQAEPTATLGTFLTLIGVTLVFATGLHQMFIAAMVKSFTLFAPGHAPPVKEMGALAVRMTAETFALGVQLAAPVIVFSLVFNVATGLVARVMPQFQVFFAATPLALLLGLSVFALSTGLIGLVWMSRFTAFLDRLG